SAPCSLATVGASALGGDGRAALPAEHDGPVPLGAAGRAFGLCTAHAAASPRRRRAPLVRLTTSQVVIQIKGRTRPGWFLPRSESQTTGGARGPSSDGHGSNHVLRIHASSRSASAREGAPS